MIVLDRTRLTGPLAFRPRRRTPRGRFALGCRGRSMRCSQACPPRMKTRHSHDTLCDMDAFFLCIMRAHWRFPRSQIIENEICPRARSRQASKPQSAQLVRPYRQKRQQLIPISCTNPRQNEKGEGLFAPLARSVKQFARYLAGWSKLEQARRFLRAPSHRSIVVSARGIVRFRKPSHRSFVTSARNALAQKIDMKRRLGWTVIHRAPSEWLDSAPGRFAASALSPFVRTAKTPYSTSSNSKLSSASP